jgi:hypothetical protein
MGMSKTEPFDWSRHVVKLGKELARVEELAKCHDECDASSAAEAIAQAPPTTKREWRIGLGTLIALEPWLRELAALLESDEPAPLPDPEPDENSKPAGSQDYAQVVGIGMVAGLGLKKANELADLIRSQSNTETTGWGEPVVDGDGLRVWIRRGPMLGAWRADLRRTLEAVLGEDAEVIVAKREVLARRAEYDEAVRQVGKDGARQRLASKTANRTRRTRSRPRSGSRTDRLQGRLRG